MERITKAHLLANTQLCLHGKLKVNLHLLENNHKRQTPKIHDIFINLNSKVYFYPAQLEIALYFSGVKLGVMIRRLA